MHHRRGSNTKVVSVSDCQSVHLFTISVPELAARSTVGLLLSHRVRHWLSAGRLFTLESQNEICRVRLFIGRQHILFRQWNTVLADCATGSYRR